MVVDVAQGKCATRHANQIARTWVVLVEARAQGRAFVVEARVRSAERQEDRFSVTLEDGRMVLARRLLVLTGLTDELPEVPGLRERWGHDVVHCPST
jgi:thioredoxin reductase